MGDSDDRRTPSFTAHNVVVVIPTFNEIDNLEVIVHRTLATVPDVSILVVDDDSPDGTGRLADDLSASDSRVHVLHRTTKDGLGAAYLAGFDWALRRDHDVVVEMDADGSHRPEQLPDLLAALDRADLVLGSRWVAGGGVENWPRSRELLSRGGNAYARRALRIPLADATSGFRAFRASALRAIDLQDVASHGYCFQVDLARRVIRAGLRVREVPISFREREAGTSKMTGSIVGEALARVSWWGVSDRLHGQRRAVAVPVAPPVVQVPTPQAG